MPGGRAWVRLPPGLTVTSLGQAPVVRGGTVTSLGQAPVPALCLVVLSLRQAPIRSGGGPSRAWVRLRSLRPGRYEPGSGSAALCQVGGQGGRS